MVVCLVPIVFDKRLLGGPEVAAGPEIPAGPIADPAEKHCKKDQGPDSPAPRRESPSATDHQATSSVPVEFEIPRILVDDDLDFGVALTVLFEEGGHVTGHGQLLAHHGRLLLRGRGR